MHQPCVTAAAAAAAALDPDASVSPCPALPDDDAEVARRVGPHELDVRALREALVALDKWAEPQQLIALRLAPEDGVRVADRDRRELEALAADLDRLGRADLGEPEIDLDLVSADTGGDEPLAQAHAGEGDPAPPREPECGDPRPVARDLGARPVRVPDDDVGLGSPDVRDLEDAVRADPVVRVAETPHLVGHERGREISPLDEQVRVTERVPLRESHRPPRPGVGRRRS